jgi:hypothetical protein
LIIFWPLFYLVAIGQQFPEGDHTFIIVNGNNSQRDQLWGQMELNFAQMPGIQWDINVQMCQPAKWMSQLRENTAKTHLHIKSTEQVQFIKVTCTTADDDGFQWGQLTNK